MSATGITQGIIDNLSAASAIGACQVATHWAVLESSPCQCAVVSGVNLNSDPWALGGQHERIYEHQVILYVKDRSGNSRIINDQMQQLIDTSVCSLETDKTLQGNIDIREFQRLTVNYDPSVRVQITAGAAWYFADMSIFVREWPTNEE